MPPLPPAAWVVDLTVEGLLHAPELPRIIAGGARMLMISNEHPDALERLLPQPRDKDRVREAVSRIRAATKMTVSSRCGYGSQGCHERRLDRRRVGLVRPPGLRRHWPAGLVVSFPAAHSVNGTLVLDAGDINLTFKRYLERPVRLTIVDDYVTEIEGEGTDAELTRRYLAAGATRRPMPSPMSASA